MKITMLDWPTDADWMDAKQRALITVGKTAQTEPTQEWKHAMLVQRHSPIRKLMFSFLIEGLPYWLSTELSRHHVGAQPYIKSQRNDRQADYDRNAARQDAPVNMIWDVDAESLMIICNKRLCRTARIEAQQVMQEIKRQVYEECPEFIGVLVPNCLYHGGVCHESNGCGFRPYDGMNAE